MKCTACSQQLALTECTACGRNPVPSDTGRPPICNTCWFSLPFSPDDVADLRQSDMMCAACAASASPCPPNTGARGARWGAQLGCTPPPMPVPVAAPSKRLLIVDDDADLLESATDILENHGFIVSLALDGKQAMSWLQSPGTPPDAILMDMRMPGMDGEMFSMARKAVPAYAEIPLVIWSAHTVSPEKTQFMSAAAFLKKPCEANKLVAVINDAIAQQE